MYNANNFRATTSFVKGSARHQNDATSSQEALASTAQDQSITVTKTVTVGAQERDMDSTRYWDDRPNERLHAY